MTSGLDPNYGGDAYRSVEFELVNKTYEMRIMDEAELSKGRRARLEQKMRENGTEVDIYGRKTCTHNDRRRCMCLTINCQIQYCNICGGELYPEDISRLI